MVEVEEEEQGIKEESAEKILKEETEIIILEWAAGKI